MKKYCELCGKEVETKIIVKKERYDVCGESIEVEAKVLTCAECGEEFYCEELDNATLLSAYNEYRIRHKLLLPDEIREIRQQYGLSQRSFAKLLNWGDKTLHRYENGALQDKAHNSLLIFLRNPQNMQSYLQENEILLEDRQKEKLLKRVDELTINSANSNGRKLVELIFQKSPCIENGFKSFDFEKFCAMVTYFAVKSGGVLKVKLMKLLNYSDMIFYQENGISISGTQYIHLPYGPVPQNYDILFGMMEADQVMHIEVEFYNGYEKHWVVSDGSIAEGILTEKEIEVLQRVYDKFSDFGSVEISNYSHKEKGYKDTEKGDVISYAYAKDIRFD